MDQIKSFEQRFGQELNKYPVFDNLEYRTKIPRTRLVGIFVGVYLFMIYFNIGGIGQLFSNTAAVVIPGYYSLVALETPGKSDDMQFLTYWVVFAAFTIIEFWSSFILYWVPAYWLFKTIFFLWLGLPTFSGARYVYSSLLQPFAVRFLGIRRTASSLNDPSPNL